MTTPPPGSREAAQALDEIENATEALADMAREFSMGQTRREQRLAREAIATLRAALAPPADGAGEVEGVRNLTDAELLATKGYPDVGQLNAYYYSFEATGVPEIDAILGGVGSAGKGYHHTEGWDEELGSGEFQFSYIDRIQGAALLAAKKMATLLRLLSEERARRVEVEAKPLEWSIYNHARGVAGEYQWSEWLPAGYRAVFFSTGQQCGESIGEMHPSQDAAKAACQQHHSEHVMGLLVSRTTQGHKERDNP